MCTGCTVSPRTCTVATLSASYGTAVPPSIAQHSPGSRPGRCRGPLAHEPVTVNVNMQCAAGAKYAHLLRLMGILLSSALQRRQADSGY